MAYRNNFTRPQRTNSNSSHNLNGSTFTFLRKLQLQLQAQNSTRLVGFLTLLITSTILLLFTGLTVTAAILGLLLFSPILIISSPIWVPIGIVLFMFFAGFLLFCGFVVAAVFGVKWMYMYFKGLKSSRNRMHEMVPSNLKDYARDYSLYLQSKVKDTAPGA